MNYRHAYHAGNFADCMKHALLVSLIGSFLRKPTPFMVLDTHAALAVMTCTAPRLKKPRNGKKA